MLTSIYQRCLFIALLLLAMPAYTQEIREIPLWPQGAPTSNGILLAETAPDEKGRIQNISEATLFVYLPKSETTTGKALLICPGGGYRLESIRSEGHQFAQWLAEQGIASFVLKYRLPNGQHAIPLSDAKQAMCLIRQQAASWGVDSEKIGVAGFSAGGHLASSLLTHFDENSKPNFGVLFYPVISMSDSLTHLGSKTHLLGKHYTDEELRYYSTDLQVSSNTPPCLLLLSDDDKTVSPLNSIYFYAALKQHKVPASMHIFPSGGHGWGYKDSFSYHRQMKSILLDWILKN